MVFEQETAIAALARFSRAVVSVLAAHPEGDIVIVTHGRVLSLYLGALTATNPSAIWKGLGLPDLRVIERPDAS